MHFNKFIKDGVLLSLKGVMELYVENERVDYWDCIDHFYFSDSGGFDDGGETEKCLRYFYTFLDIIQNRKWEQGAVNDSAEWYTVIHVFECNDLIESGVSVRVPWLTEKGKMLVEDLEELFIKVDNV